MMHGIPNEFKHLVDMDVYRKQQNAPQSAKDQSQAMQGGSFNQEPEDKSKTDYPIGPQGRDQKNTVNTFLGPMPSHEDFKKYLEDPNTLNEMVGGAIGGPGMKMMGKLAEPIAGAAKQGIKKAYDYVHPAGLERKAEEFRGSLGEGTSKENIEAMSKRAQFAKGSAREEALIPKRELYKQEGKSNVYDIGKENLPEGNLERIAGMAEPGGQFAKGQMDALSKALKDYRKSGNVDSFLSKSEDIFNIEELPKKAAAKIEDALLLPTKRESKYFGDEGVSEFYGKKGELKSLHDQFEKKPTLSNYDALQSAIKKQQRVLDQRAKAGTITDVAESKLGQLNENIKNLNADKEQFMQTLPDKMQNLENEFRQKYASGVGKYEKGAKDTGASLTLRRLAEGKHSLVTDEQITKVFAHPTAADKKIMLDMGPSAARNALYSALQKVPVGDAEKMAKTVLDLKRTKGFDEIVTKDMENWAHNTLKHSSRADFLRKGLTSVGAGLAGSAMLGPVGGVLGAAAPWSLKAGKLLAEKLKK